MADWRKSFDVNVFGVVEMVRAMLPAMQQADGDHAIVNVGSKQGITNPPGHPVYNMGKAALKTYTELLEHDLREQDGARVHAHLLISGWTTTGHNEPKPGAWSPEQVVEFMEAGINDGTFYMLCPDDETTPEMDRARVLWGAGDITENRPPLSRWDPAWAGRRRKFVTKYVSGNPLQWQ